MGKSRKYLPLRPTEFGRRFSLDGRAKAVEVNIVADCGRRWANVTTVKPFGLKSSAWLGRPNAKTGRHCRKQGLKHQTEKMLRAAEQHPINGEVPRVQVIFRCGVTREVADALMAMGAEVVGDEVERSRKS